jgi:hypothetical protein
MMSTGEDNFVEQKEDPRMNAMFEEASSTTSQKITQLKDNDTNRLRFNPKQKSKIEEDDDIIPSSIREPKNLARFDFT